MSEPMIKDVRLSRGRLSCEAMGYGLELWATPRGVPKLRVGCTLYALTPAGLEKWVDRIHGYCRRAPGHSPKCPICQENEARLVPALTLLAFIAEHWRALLSGKATLTDGAK